MALLPDFNRFLKKYPHKNQALYHSLREAIRRGTLAPNELLPPSRELAGLYGLSRGTVSLAYDSLFADGYLVTRPGAGTFVAPGIAKPVKPKPKKRRPPLSRWGASLPPLHEPEPSFPGALDMRHGKPDGKAFPEADWKQAAFRALREINYSGLEHGVDPRGLPGLRKSIAAYLNRHRGLALTENEIVVLNGSQQAISLLCRLLIRKGDPVVLENPSYRGTRNAVSLAGGRPVFCEVDHDGMLPPTSPARLMIVTPSNQFPTGSVLTPERRNILLKLARKFDALIIEDDYDSEFRRSGHPLEPLKALDEDNRVIYTGSFSKTVGNFLRLGYVALPEYLVDPFMRAKQTYESSASALLEQMTLHEFMRNSGYEKHLRRMNRIYGKKHDLFHALFKEHLPEAFHWNPSRAGLHNFGWWRRKAGELKRFQELCIAQSVLWTNPASYFNGASQPAAFFGYSHLSENQTRTAVKKMGRIYNTI